MTDLVERLRMTGCEGCLDAADEIERLRAIAQAHNDSLVARIAENAKLKERIRFADQDCAAECASLRAEVERLTKECEEQARLNGMGGERELALRAENERLREALREMDAEYLKLRLFLLKLAAYEDSYSPMQLQEIALDLLGVETEKQARAALQSEDGPGTATYNERWKSKE
jgi:hypothetical protein